MPGPRKVSKVWSFFTRQTDGSAQCHLCGNILSYKSSTTNLAKHLERKHPAVLNGTGEDDAREGLKEFITLDTGDSFHNEEDNDDGPSKESVDNEWTPPKKFLRKTLPQVVQKKVKPELISTSGVDYLIYPSHEPARAPSRVSVQPAPRTGTSETKKLDEDEFSIFARFVAQRIRSLKDPYWQSCAINELNSALHKVEMRRYEPPRAVVSSDFSSQTETEQLLRPRKIYEGLSSNDTVNEQVQIRTEVVEEIVTSHEVVECLSDGM